MKSGRSPKIVALTVVRQRYFFPNSSCYEPYNKVWLLMRREVSSILPRDREIWWAQTASEMGHAAPWKITASCFTSTKKH